jgi:hypothetical protein
MSAFTFPNWRWNGWYALEQFEDTHENGFFKCFMTRQWTILECWKFLHMYKRTGMWRPIPIQYEEGNDWNRGADLTAENSVNPCSCVQKQIEKKCSYAYALEPLECGNKPRFVTEIRYTGTWTVSSYRSIRHHLAFCSCAMCTKQQADSPKLTYCSSSGVHISGMFNCDKVANCQSWNLRARIFLKTEVLCIYTSWSSSFVPLPLSQHTTVLCICRE